MIKPQINLFIGLLLLPCFTYFSHECAHGLAYLFFEIDFNLKLNTIVLQAEPMPFTKIQKIVIYGSGVGFSFLQGFVGFLLLKKYRASFGFLLLLSAAVFRWAAIFQGIWAGSDEKQMSLAMGLPTAVWPLFISLSFLIMVLFSKKKMAVSNRKLFGTIFLFLLVTFLFSLI